MFYCHLLFCLLLPLALGLLRPGLFLASASGQVFSKVDGERIQGVLVGRVLEIVAAVFRCVTLPLFFALAETKTKQGNDHEENNNSWTQRERPTTRVKKRQNIESILPV